METNVVYRAPALELLKSLPNESVDVIFTDPPFNTRKVRKSAQGHSYIDSRDNYYDWLKEHVVECHRVLKKTGTMYLHLNEKASSYARVLVMDPVFGERNHLNTLIWSFDYGGRGKKKFAAKHEVILSYTKSMGAHVFNWDDIDRIPYMAPGLQKDKVKAARGKVPTDVWWMSIVGTQSKERVGWPTQKPIKLVQRAIVASSPPDGIILDPFVGSGTTAVAATLSGRTFIVGDELKQAIDVTHQRLIALAIPHAVKNLLEESSVEIDEVAS